MRNGQADPEFESRAQAALVEIRRVEHALAQAAAAQQQRIAVLPSETRAAALNLVHYVALRQLDIRPLQRQLTELGLSSLGRAEAAVEDAVLRTGNMLRRALHQAPQPHADQAGQAARAELLARARELFGGSEPPAVMVTMPSEAADDPALVRELLISGMNVMRVNCAHDDERAWTAMVANLRSAERELGMHCKVVFDLPGPKLRTLGLAPGPRVLHLSPPKDERGHALQVARITLRGVKAGHPGEPAPAEVWVPATWLRRLELGDEVTLHDVRGKARRLRVARCAPNMVECETDRSIYLDESTELCLRRPHAPAASARPVRVPARPQILRLQPGDLLWLKADGSLGQPATTDRPASISCAVPELLAALAPNQSVWFDDGKIGATVEELGSRGALLRIRHTRAGGAALKSEKGINAPDTDLSRLPLLSPADLAALDVAAQHADSVGLLFTRCAADVALLHQRLAERGLDRLGIILKIETRAGFEALPEILFEALKRPKLGVMIARGDLAVECGFERLAELQEEMLWLCEAARVPSIWATQVLEGLTKKGHASRAEITDAAMSERAECVMLNKGPYLREAIRCLRDVLARMRGHQEKKRSMLRPLRSIRLQPHAND